MDGAVRLPVIGPVGLDAVLGLFPVAGDVLSAGIAVSLIGRSLKYGVPHELIGRMLGNVLFDLILGSVAGRRRSSPICGSAPTSGTSPCSAPILTNRRATRSTPAPPASRTRLTLSPGAPMPLIVLLALVVSVLPCSAQEARRRWETERQIRLDKFEQVLPKAMRDNGIDMWIVAVKENHREPLWNDLGRGYVSGIGYYVFTDRGRPNRASRARAVRLPARQSGAYDTFASADAGRIRQGARSAPHRRQHVRRDRSGRWPVRDDARASEEDAGRAFASRLVSAEKLVVRLPLASRGIGDRGVRRSRRHRGPVGRARVVERGHYARQDDARRRRVVDAGSPARSRARLRIRHAVGLCHRTERHRRDLHATGSSSPATSS